MLLFIGIESFFIFSFILLLLFCYWKIFEKAGQPGWASIVPIYNMIVMCRIAKKPGYWVLLQFIPYIGAIFSIWIINRMVKGFGKSEGFTVGLIFLGFIFLPIWAFDNSEYDPNRLD